MLKPDVDVEKSVWDDSAGKESEGSQDSESRRYLDLYARFFGAALRVTFAAYTVVFRRLVGVVVRLGALGVGVTHRYVV